MPEYLAPGVFVEEVSYRAKSIEGVSTTTTGFVGATRYGPIDIEPDVITSLVEYERVYGGRQKLEFTNAGAPVDNYMWNAVRAFFEEGGKRLYVARAFGAPEVDGKANVRAACATVAGALVPPANVAIRARFPGKAGDSRVRLQFSLGANRLTFEASPGTTKPVLRGAANRDVVFVDKVTAGGARKGLHLLTNDPQTGKWTFDDGKGGTFDLDTVEIPADPVTDSNRPSVRIITASVFVEPTSPGLPFFGASGLALDRGHRSGGKPDSLFDYFAVEPGSLSAARSIPIVIEALTADEAKVEDKAAADLAAAAKKADKKSDDDLKAAKKALADAQKAVADALALDPNADTTALDAAVEQAGLKAGAATSDRAAAAAALAEADDRAAAAAAVLAAALSGTPRTGLQVANDYLALAPSANRFTVADITGDPNADPPLLPKDPFLDAVFYLTGGSDGAIPEAGDYEGAEDDQNRKSGLVAFEDVEDISIVAAPGSTFVDTYAQGVANLLISHAERMKYRIAVLDSIKGASIAETRAYRGKFDSSHAAFYYPWVRIIDAETGQENHYPPSGFVAGIYARNDIDRAVYKAPANEVVRLAIGFEKFLNKAQQEVLNPEGINCFRFFEGRGMRLWGARTATSDPEWKYVNLRRYFAYLERSIDKGTQWAVFEPNGDRLWANVRRTIEDFLLNEWQNGALLGDKPEKAYFVKCDRSTMTQNDLDNGRLVCQVGVAPLRPAEFVIFRIGQWTADRKA